MDLMGMFCRCRAVERFVLPDSRVRTISVTTKILFFYGLQVASLLSESQKRIRLYEMEVEEDDEEFDMSQNNSLDISRESKQSN